MCQFCNDGRVTCETCHGEGELPNGVACLCCCGFGTVPCECQRTPPAPTREERDWVIGFFGGRLPAMW
jgi:hypothetical protein